MVFYEGSEIIVDFGQNIEIPFVYQTIIGFFGFDILTSEGSHDLPFSYRKLYDNQRSGTISITENAQFSFEGYYRINIYYGRPPENIAFAIRVRSEFSISYYT